MKARLLNRLTLLLLLFLIGATSPVAAQDSCGMLKTLMQYNYREHIHTGKFRECGADPVCLAQKAYEIAQGAPVATAINGARAAALLTNPQPIPNEIRVQLNDMFPAHILDKVRFTVAPITIAAFVEELNDAKATTFDDIIVIYRAENVMSAPLWAHELEHVIQYEQLDVDGFAQAYAAQTCLLPGNTALGGYASDTCQIEGFARLRKSLFLAVGPQTLILKNAPLEGPTEFKARDTIILGANVVLRSGAKIKLSAGRHIRFDPGFHSEPGGKLTTEINPSLQTSCLLP